MFKFVVFAACVLSANAGVLQTGVVTSYAAAPAVISAPILSKTTVLPAETTIVKQPVVVDQHVTQYRSIPTVVQTAPIVRTVVAQPALTYAHAAPFAYSGLGYAAGLPIHAGFGYAF